MRYFKLYEEYEEYDETEEEIIGVHDDAYIEIYPEDRIVNTNSTIIRKIDVTDQLDISSKPKGMWYSIGTEWLDYVRDNLPNREEQNVLRVDIDEWRMCILKTYQEKKDFENKYGLKSQWGEKNNTIDQIDWTRVGEDYSGIEIINPWGDIGHWLNPWDISSGCIWKPNAIKSYELL